MATSPAANRRRRYQGRRHQVDTRPQGHTVVEGGFVWYRGPSGDHAFGSGTSAFLRSACKNVRWDVRMHLVEGSVNPCAACRAVAEPITESEHRLLDGNR